MNWLQNHSQRAWLVLRKPVVLLNSMKLLKKPALSETVSVKPTHLVFYPTDKCNLRCSWCLRERTEAKEIQHAKMQDLDLRSFGRILDCFPSLTSISFAGQGELFLNSQAIDMIGLAGKRKLRVYITTNGLILNENRIQQLITSNVVQINISLKGMDPIEYAGVTGTPGYLFNRQIKIIEKLVQAKKRNKSRMDVRVSYVVDCNTYQNMGPVINRMDALGVDKILFDNLVPFHDLKTGHLSLFADDTNVVQHIKSLAGTARKASVEFPVLLKRDGFSYFCPGFYNVLNVDRFGNVSGCMRVLTPSPSYGNIFEMANVTNNPYFRHVRGLFLKKEMPNHCRTCVEMSREYPSG